MKKSVLFLLLLVVSLSGANAQLLYKITGKGLKSPSYIVGTYHLAPATFIDSIPGANVALDEVEQVCGEVVMSEMNGFANQSKVMDALMLPDSKSITDVLTSEQMDKLNAYMNRVLGADFNNPMIKMAMGNMTPGAISSQLQLLLYMKETPNFDPNNLIDSHFQILGKKAGKSIIGFESVDFQIDLLYKSTPLERQVVQLMCMIENDEFYNLQTKHITEAYFAQDLAKVFEAFEDKLNSLCDSTPEEENRILYDRNSNWVGIMPAMMAEKPTLFVVGAAHLPSERGVLELLKARGYTVEAVR